MTKLKTHVCFYVGYYQTTISKERKENKLKFSSDSYKAGLNLITYFRNIGKVNPDLLWYFLKTQTLYVIKTNFINFIKFILKMNK